MAKFQAIVQDKTRREHIGTIEKILWSDDEQPCSILALTDTHVVLIDAPGTDFHRGQKVRFLGKWEDSQRGPRFRADTFVRDTPHTEEGVLNYLSDVCSNVGVKTAYRLWVEYGPDAVRTLRESPEKVVSAGLMSESAASEASSDLRQYAHHEQTRVDLFGLLNGRGFAKNLVNLAIRKWGAKAPAVIRKDPYKLLTAQLPSCGFKRCDTLYLDLGGNKESLKRQTLAGWNALAEDRTGSTWVPAVAVSDAIRAAVPAAVDPVRAIQLGIRAKLFSLIRDGQERYVARSEHARQERAIASAILALQSGPSLWPVGIQSSQEEGDGLPSDHQSAVASAPLASPVGILGGGPGTGKTHVLRFILRAILSQCLGTVAVCAPTGKAAIRARESLEAGGIRDVQVSTIHSLLMRLKPGELLPFDFLVVDESSMIGTDLMAELLAKCRFPAVIPGVPERTIPADLVPMANPKCRRCGRPLTNPDSWEIGYGPECAKRVDPSEYAPVIRSAGGGEAGHGGTVTIAATEPVRTSGTHILFIGDRYQLAPVSHGAPLRDMIAAAVAYGELTETRRNSGAIVRGCAAIKEGKPPVFSDRVNLETEDPENLLFLDCGNDETLDVIEDTLRAMSRFHPVWDTQILVPTNDGRKRVNDALKNVLNPDGYRVAGVPFAVGDKVICLSNSNLSAANPHHGPGGQLPEDSGRWQQEKDVVHYFANGEVCRVLAVGNAGLVIESGSKTAWVPKSKSRKSDDESDSDGEPKASGGLNDFDLAYAITGHKSQGSEWPVVLVLAEKSGFGVADRHWWYTAISRASKACLVIGDRSAFRTQCLRQSLSRRKTFLAELIENGAQPGKEADNES